MIGEGKTITHYFNFRKQPKNRHSDFVLLPQRLVFEPESDTLDFDSEQLASFGSTTLNLLLNSGKKVFPYPVLADVLDDLPTDDRQSHLTLKSCAKYLQQEKQFVPTFHIVGHGTPDGVGILDPQQQISPEAFAEKIATVFKHYELEFLMDKPIHFVFHTCNSAYAKVEPSMGKPEILKKVKEESYIGRFYQAMKGLGFASVSVTGYRGYYSTITSNHTRSAVIADSFTSPTFSTLCSQGEYTVSDKGCETKCSNDKYLRFPIPLLDVRKGLTEELSQSGLEALNVRLRNLKLV